MTFPLKHPENRELLGGDLLAQTLAHLGCRVAFGLHGGHLDAFLVGAVNAGIKLVDTRHETVAVQAAESYAKLSGNTGVAFVTANSGFCNALAGIATAFADRSPVFVVTSSPPLRDAETNCLQGFHDQVVLAKPITKFAHRVTNVEEIPRITAYAWRQALSGAPGPVVVDYPIDILFSPPRVEAIAYGSMLNEMASPPSPDPNVLQKLVKLWSFAQRPALIVGTGAARASDLIGNDIQNTLLIQLAEATSTPVFHSSKFSPRIPASHPLRAGPAGGLAALPAIGSQPPDLIILLGARTGFLLGGRSGRVIPDGPDCKLIQIDIDGGEIGRSHAVDLGVVSDSCCFIRSILPLVENDSAFNFGRKDGASNGWILTTSRLKNLVHTRYQNESSTMADGRMHPYHAIKALYQTLAPREPIVLIDGGECGVWAFDLMESVNSTHTLVSTGHLGFLGNGWGYALGASEACPDKLIVNIQGDGSAGFHIQELDTYARHERKILTVVVNNHAWGMSLAGQNILFTNPTTELARPVSSLSPQCRYDIIAQGFNCLSAIIADLDYNPNPSPNSKTLESTIRDLITQILQTNRPGLVNLIVSTQPVTTTTTAMVGKPISSAYTSEQPERQSTDDSKKWIVVPYYDNILRPGFTA